MSNNVAYNPAYPGVYYYYNYYYKNWGVASNTPYNVPYNHVYNWNYQIGYNQSMDSNNLDDSDDGSDVGPCMSFMLFVWEMCFCGEMAHKAYIFFSFQEMSSFFFLFLLSLSCFNQSVLYTSSSIQYLLSSV